MFTIKVRKVNSKYVDVVISCDSTTIEVGLLDHDEMNDMIVHLDDVIHDLRVVINDV